MEFQLIKCIFQQPFVKIRGFGGIFQPVFRLIILFYDDQDGLPSPYLVIYYVPGEYKTFTVDMQAY